MADLIPPFVAGQKLTAAHLEQVRQAALGFARQGAGMSMGGGGAAHAWLDQIGPYVLVHNNTGGARTRFDVLGIGGIHTSSDPGTKLPEFKSVVVLTGNTPDEDDHGDGRFCVLLDDLPAGAIGPAAVAGCVQVQIDMDDADHKYADIKDGAYTLQSGDSGPATILAVESGTGTKWGVVRFGAASGTSHPTLITGTTTSAVEADDATFTVNDCVAIQPDGADDPDDGTTVYNLLAGDIDSGAMVYAVWNFKSERYECINAPCPAEGT
ncbi:MAG: hypothetical protein ACOY3P_20165 [Planctomycetota bacterium]